MNGRLIGIEARRGIGPWCLPIILALAWVYLRGQSFGFATMLWIEASVAVRNTVFFAGPCLAATAAWMAGRERRRGLGELLATTPRPTLARQGATWLGTALWGLAAYGAVALSIGVLTARTATWGRPILWPPAIGLLALLAHAAVGFAAGRLLPSRFTAPLVAVTLYFAQAFMGFGSFGALRLPIDPRLGWLPYLSPIAELGQSVWYGVTPDVGLPQAVFLLGIIGLAFAALALRERRSLPAWGLCAVAALLVVAGAVLVQRAVPGSERERWAARQADPAAGLIPFTPVCLDGPLPICAHPAYRPWLEENAPLVGRLASPLLGLPGGPTRAEQWSPFLSLPYGTTLVLHPQPRPGTFGPDIARRLVSDYDILQGRFSDDYVVEHCPDDGSRFRHRSCGQAQNAVALWLLWQAGERPAAGPGLMQPEVVVAAERFGALPEAARRVWLRENLVALREWRVPLGALPAP